jgi:hypothetical protein
LSGYIFAAGCLSARAAPTIDMSSDETMTTVEIT